MQCSYLYLRTKDNSKLYTEEAEAYLGYAEPNLPSFCDVCVISRNKSEEKKHAGKLCNRLNVHRFGTCV